MVDGYALLAIPFASFIQFVAEKKWYYRSMFYMVAVFFMLLNIFQMYQLERSALHYDGMTSTLYFKQFGKIDMIENFGSYVDPPNYEEALKGQRNKAVADTKSPPQPTITPKENVMAPIQNYYTNTKEKNRKQIYLQAFNNKFVCADGDMNAQVLANKDKASVWETFSLIMFEGNTCAFLSFTNNFLCAELNSRAQLTNSRSKVEGWETFTLIELDGGYIALKGANGNYVSVDESSLELVASSAYVGEREKFKLIPVPSTDTINQ